MRIAQRHAAARNALAGLLTAATMLPATTFAADRDQPLLLPLVAAITLGARAASASYAGATGRTPVQPVSIIPPHMHIPDLYAVEVGRDPMRCAEPLDDDRQFAIDLFPRRQRGWMASFIYDTESPQVLGRSSNLLRIGIEFDF